VPDCNALQRTLQSTAKNESCHTCGRVMTHMYEGVMSLCPLSTDTIHDAASHCNTLQHTATHCNALLHTATHCNILQRTATHCNTLQHTAMHYNTLQCTTTHCYTLQHTARHCYTLQHVHYSVLQCAVVCYSNSWLKLLQASPRLHTRSPNHLQLVFTTHFGTHLLVVRQWVRHTETECCRV